MADPRAGASDGLPLAYAEPDDASAGRRSRTVARLSIGLALFGFPVEALTSIVLDTVDLVPDRVAERAGFMLFAVMEGCAAACGTLGAIQTRHANRRAHATAVAGAILGAVGSLIVLFMIAVGAIR